MTKCLPLLVLLLATAAAPVATAQEGGAPASDAEAYDVLIRGGRLLDGTGNPWVRADVALRGDRVAAVGRLQDAAADTVIDATGLYVAPGFIDTHTHAGAGLATPARSGARPQLAQGVTTVVVNPDGGGALDFAAQRDMLLMDGLGVNVAQLVPHGEVREAVLGMDDRAPAAEELARMEALVQAGMEAGGFGLSSGPFYAPGSYAETAELVALARVAAAYGGVYQSHIRDESNYSIGVVAAVDEVIAVARTAGLPGIVTHIKALGPPVWGFSHALVRRIDRARSEGVSVFADQYPYNASATGLVSALVPRWAEAGGRDSLLARLDDPALQERLRMDMTENLARRGGADRIQFRRHEADTSIEGTTLAEVAAARGLEPVEAALSLIREGAPRIVSFNMDDADVHTLMRQPWTMTSSDGGLVPMGQGVPHPRNYGAFPRKLRVYVVEEGVIELAAAVRSMTALPAAVFGMEGRGLVRAGAAADVVVFDLDRVRDRGTFREPHQLAEGMVHVFVNGRMAVRDGRFTGTLGGRVLSRNEAHPPGEASSGD